jgi:uncharacterized protein (TIGR03435 family)
MRAPIGSTALVVACAAALAQFPQPGQSQPAFEVASMKLADPGKGMPADLMRLSEGPETPDPEHFIYTNVPLGRVLLQAFDVQPFQLSGPIPDARYDINAKFVPGTTTRQINLMLQNLLVERLRLKFHHESRSVQGYELIVAKSGVKMQESAAPVGLPVLPDTTVWAPDGARGGYIDSSTDKSGLAELSPGRKGRLLFPLGAGRQRISARLQTLADIVSMCQNQIRQPVVDKTGLTGTYDFNLDFSMNMQPSSTVEASSATGPPLADARDEGLPFAAAIQTLGLRLQPSKVAIDVVVIDRIERIPIAN